MTKYFTGKVTFHTNGIINAEKENAKCKCWNIFRSALYGFCSCWRATYTCESITTRKVVIQGTSEQWACALPYHFAASNCFWSITIRKGSKWKIDRTVFYLQQESHKSIKSFWMSPCEGLLCSSILCTSVWDRKIWPWLAANHAVLCWRERCVISVTLCFLLPVFPVC